MAVKVIAEAGVNHNGSFELASRLVEEAARAGADVVKFQTFQSDLVVTPYAEKAKYQQRNLGGDDSQLEMLRKLELRPQWHYDLRDQCKSLKLEFMSTPFDSPSLTFLVEQLQVSTLKIPSGELTNGPLLLEFARSGCDLILSTGMATAEEVRLALSLIGWGLMEKTRDPRNIEEFREAWLDQSIRQLVQSKVTVLHCTSQYPAPPETVNLRAMNSLHDDFDLPVGYSDHTAGIAVPIAAVARGACVIEKHFTVDRNLPGPDHLASLEPDQLKEMVEGIRLVESALGDGIKMPHACEKDTANVARRSLVLARDIRRGEVITSDQLIARRPGTGVSPMCYWDFLGTNANEDYRQGELLKSK